MKTLLFILSLVGFLNSCAPAKKIDKGTEFQYSLKHALIPAALSFQSGAFYGVHETVVHHPDRIPERWNKQWWDNRLSWTNKGETFIGKTIGSFGSDAKHTFGPLHRWHLFGAGLSIGIGQKRKWWHYAIDAGVSFVAFSAGFHSVYSIGFRQKH